MLQIIVLRPNLEKIGVEHFSPSQAVKFFSPFVVAAGVQPQNVVLAILNVANGCELSICATSDPQHTSCPARPNTGGTCF